MSKRPTESPTKNEDGYEKQADLPERQQRCLLAILLLLEDRASRNMRWDTEFTAGQIAWKLGFRHGPRQHGNGAKDGRSFTGYGARGKWTGPSLRSLGRRGLVYGHYRDLRGRDRMRHYKLTSRGLAAAQALKGKINVVDPASVKENR